MSEYQYYEFLAIDRPLSKEQMAELRALSTRATITPTRFQNTYNYGDFRGDPEKLIEKYFDVFVYVANWGTHWLMLRLPRQLLDVKTAALFCTNEGLKAWVKGEHTILSFRSELEDPEWEEGEGWMAQLAPLRAELAAGDLRCLYLGWLAGVPTWQLDEEGSEGDDGGVWDEAGPGLQPDDIEPDVPAGLGKLSAPLEALAEFLWLDRDLLAIAADRSAPLPAGPSPSDWERWLRGLSQTEKDGYLLRLLAEGDTRLQAELRQRFQSELAATRPTPAQTPARRTVGELLVAAAEHAKRRRREEEKRAAREREHREREAAAARERYLDDLVGQEEDLWQRVEALVEVRRGKENAEAVQILLDLRDLAARAGTETVFAARLSRFRERHTGKQGLLRRLGEVGLGGT